MSQVSSAPQHLSTDSDTSSAVDKRDISQRIVQSLGRSVELASTVGRKGKHASIIVPEASTRRRQSLEGRLHQPACFHRHLSCLPEGRTRCCRLSR